MKWPTWNEAAIAAAISLAVSLWARRRGRRLDRGDDHVPSRWATLVAPATREFALIATLYSIWRIARKLPLAKDEGAIERAYRIVDWQRALHLPDEVTLLDFVARHDWLAWTASAYYAALHVSGLVAFLIWLWWRHRDRFPHWRNGLAFVTAGCLVIRYVRVAPPRMLPDLGYYDLASQHGFDLYGPVGTGVSDQFAAMPSIHVAWAAVVSFGIISASPSRWRWIFGLHVILTFLVVAATGNHWWLDGIVAVVLLLIGLALDTLVRTRRERARRAAPCRPAPRGDAEGKPAPDRREREVAAAGVAAGAGVEPGPDEVAGAAADKGAPEGASQPTH